MNRFILASVTIGASLVSSNAGCCPTPTGTCCTEPCDCRYSDSNSSELKQLFKQFMADYKRSYGVAEEMNRFISFVQNMKVIDARNAAEKKAGGSAVHRITKFSDMTEEEFAAQFLTLDATKKLGNSTLVKATPYTGTEALVDWTGVYTTPVKDQGYCGSCWAFAASEQMESDSMRLLGTSYSLSAEQLVDCDPKSSGCDGGWPEWAYDYVESVGGIEQNSDYPYSASSGTSGQCNADPSKFVIGVTDYYTLGSESEMASHVKSTGPLSICIDASTWSTYSGGIMSACGNQINHAVQAVGVDDSSGGYWKVRNSWGTGWGEAGFIRLAYGQNTCNIDYDASYTVTVQV